MSDDPISDYYENARLKAERIRKEIKACDPKDVKRLKRLRADLEMAEYVGD